MKNLAESIIGTEDLPTLLLEADQQIHLLRKKRKEEQRWGQLEAIIPKTRSVIVPLINKYADDRDGWVEFITFIRDRFPRRGEMWGAIQKIRRKCLSNACKYRQRHS